MIFNSKIDGFETPTACLKFFHHVIVVVPVVDGTFVSVWFNKITFSFKANKRQEIRNFTENFSDETLLTFDNIYFSYAAVSYRTRKREL